MTPITCAEFDRWLDAGADASTAAPMVAHASTCPRCGEALLAMQVVDAWLAEPPAAPAGFGDAVMTRVATIEAARAPNSLPAFEDDLPWWVHALQQPAVVLSAALAALLIWRAGTLVAAGSTAAAWLATSAPSLGTRALDALIGLAGAASGDALTPGTSRLLAISLAVALAPLLTWVSLGMGSWAARAVARSTRPA